MPGTLGRKVALKTRDQLREQVQVAGGKLDSPPKTEKTEDNSVDGGSDNLSQATASQTGDQQHDKHNNKKKSKKRPRNKDSKRMVHQLPLPLTVGRLVNSPECPSFKDLPLYDRSSTKHFEYHQNGMHATPKKHWCLIGHVGGIDKTEGRLRLHMVDVTGDTAPVEIIVERKQTADDVLAKTKISMGKVAVIMYASRLPLKGGAQGVRVTDQRMASGLEVTMEELTEADEYVQAATFSKWFVRACGECALLDSGPKERCSRCKLVTFCKGECELAGMRYEQHAAICHQIMQMLPLYKVNWAAFDGAQPLPQFAPE